MHQLSRFIAFGLCFVGLHFNICYGLAKNTHRNANYCMRVEDGYWQNGCSAKVEIYWATQIGGDCDTGCMWSIEGGATYPVLGTVGVLKSWACFVPDVPVLDKSNQRICDDFTDEDLSYLKTDQSDGLTLFPEKPPKKILLPMAPEPNIGSDAAPLKIFCFLTFAMLNRRVVSITAQIFLAGVSVILVGMIAKTQSLQCLCSDKLRRMLLYLQIRHQLPQEF